VSYLSTVLKSLAVAKPDLVKKYSLESLGLFGSVVRDDFSPKSDMDILVSFTRPVGIEFIELADELEIMLKRKVDLVSRNAIKEKYFKAIEQDIVYV
jgi:predicted nucleotidyltransferase